VDGSKSYLPDRVTTIYLVFGIAWILGTDRLTELLPSDLLMRAQAYKGIVFVLVSATLIYVLLNRERHRTWAARRAHVETRRMGERILDAIPEVVCVIEHPSGVIRWCNESAVQVLGWPAGEMVGRSCRFLFADPATYEACEVQEQAAFDRGESSVLLRHPLRHKDGRTLLVDRSVRLVEGDESDPKLTVCVIRSVEEPETVEA
jgi:PAS domain S-box-containing protein